MGVVELHLRDLGVIAEASVELDPGLNVVTGETGVGKTLLVTSLALLTGARGHARLVREGAQEAVVQAVISPPASVRDALDAHGASADQDLVLVRRLAADGRSRAWVGGQLAPVSTLADVGDALIEMHGQGAGFALARPATQLAAIDALAENAGVLAKYRAALAVLRELERERERLRASLATRAREIELLSYQLEEIDRAELTADEEEQIAAALSRLENAERLQSIAASVLALAGAEGSAGALAEAHKALQAAVPIDPGTTELSKRLGDVAAEASEIARDVRSWSETLDADPAQLDALRERRALIATLKRKYGTTIPEVLEVADVARVRLEELSGADERIATIEVDVEAARDRTIALAGELTKRRRKAAKQLTKLVCGELPALALPGATFDVRHERAEPTESGADRIEFLFSSSGAKTPEPIGKIASGGELSRAMIAVTLALATAHAVPVLVFDEADQGIGGEAALELGRRLARLGRSHQVLVVSHLPQIAAFADRHITVRRRGDDVEVDVLDGADRLAEISRMLAGMETSELARAHAAELLDLASAEAATSTGARAG